MREEPHAIPDISEPELPPQGPVLRVLLAVDLGLLKVEKILLALLVLFMVVAVVFQIVTRLLNLNNPGAMEASVFAMYGVALLAGSVATHYRRHITVDILSRVISGPVRTFLSMFINTLGFVLMLYLLRAAIYYVRVNIGDEASTALKIPLWWLKALLPVAFGVMSFRFLLNAAEDAKRIRTKMWLSQDVHQHGADIRM